MDRTNEVPNGTKEILKDLRGAVESIRKGAVRKLRRLLSLKRPIKIAAGELVYKDVRSSFNNPYWVSNNYEFRVELSDKTHVRGYMPAWLWKRVKIGRKYTVCYKTSWFSGINRGTISLRMNV